MISHSITINSSSTNSTRISKCIKEVAALVISRAAAAEAGQCATCNASGIDGGKRITTSRTSAVASNSGSPWECVWEGEKGRSQLTLLHNLNLGLGERSSKAHPVADTLKKVYSGRSAKRT